MMVSLICPQCQEHWEFEDASGDHIDGEMLKYACPKCGHEVEVGWVQEMHYFQVDLPPVAVWERQHIADFTPATTLRQLYAECGLEPQCGDVVGEVNSVTQRLLMVVSVLGDQLVVGQNEVNLDDPFFASLLIRNGKVISRSFSEPEEEEPRGS